MPFTGGPLILENIKKTVRKKVRWGVLGAAKIAIDKVIPAMQQGELTEVTASLPEILGRPKLLLVNWELPGRMVRMKSYSPAQK